MMIKKVKIGVIGLGNMGMACAAALEKDQRRWQVYSYDKDKTKLRKTAKDASTRSAEELIKKAQVIILAVKPQDIKEFLEETKTVLRQNTPLLITMAAGVSTSFFEEAIKGLKVVRVMPNLAVKVKESCTFICRGKFAKKADAEIAANIFSVMGEVSFTPENNLDKVTAICGSGPGYIYYFMDCLYQNARALGFSNPAAKKMILRTFLGAAALVKTGKADFNFWLSKVSSRGGTTQAALTEWEKNNFKELVAKGITAAYQRAKELNIR